MYYLYTFVFLKLVIAVSSLTFDKALTSSSKLAVEKNEFFLTFQEIQPHRKASTNPQQVLLSLAFPSLGRLALMIDWSKSQFVIESTIMGEVERKEIEVSDFRTKPKVDFIMVEILQKSSVANVYVDCRLVGTISLPSSPKEMMTRADFHIRAYRGRHAGVSIEWASQLLNLLEKFGCPNNEIFAGDRKAPDNEIYTYRRGDIPVTHEDQKVSVLVSTLGNLIETIRELQVDIQTQREETALLRNALISCELCKPGRNIG